MMYIKISIIDEKNGMKYRKEFMRTAIDVPKLFNGGLTSVIGQTFLNGLAEAADFDLKFPIKKVKFCKAFDTFTYKLSIRAFWPSPTFLSPINLCRFWWPRTWLLICASQETSRKIPTSWYFWLMPKVLVQFCVNDSSNLAHEIWKILICLKTCCWFASNYFSYEINSVKNIFYFIFNRSKVLKCLGLCFWWGSSKQGWV